MSLTTNARVCPLCSIDIKYIVLPGGSVHAINRRDTCDIPCMLHTLLRVYMLFLAAVHANTVLHSRPYAYLKLRIYLAAYMHANNT